jgi:transcriptional regulator with XRE-family HTH domain
MNKEDLKRIRISRDLTQREFGEAVGCSESLIRAVEGGRMLVSQKLERSVHSFLKSGDGSNLDTLSGIALDIQDRLERLIAILDFKRSLTREAVTTVAHPLKYEPFGEPHQAWGATGALGDKYWAPDNGNWDTDPDNAGPDEDQARNNQIVEDQRVLATLSPKLQEMVSAVMTLNKRLFVDQQACHKSELTGN